jgi:hypothetical protein
VPASKFNTTSPCTNHPIACSLSPIDTNTKEHPALWKYNFSEHLATHHSGILIPADLQMKILISEAELKAIVEKGKGKRGPRKRLNVGEETQRGAKRTKK